MFHSNERQSCYSIDPTNLSALDKLVLFYFLTKQKEDKVNLLYPGVPYRLSRQDKLTLTQYLNQKDKVLPTKQDSRPNLTIEDKIEFTQDFIQLTHQVSFGVSEHNPDDPRWYVYNNMSDQLIAEGCFGSVYKIIGKLKTDNQSELIFKADNSLIAKIQDQVIECEDKKAFFKRIYNEVNLSKRINELNAKIPTFFSYHYAMLGSVIVEKKIPGESLQKILQADKNGDKILSTDQRIRIIIAILQSLIQLHHRHVIHRDIKPDNIIIDLSTYPIKAYFIDLGVSIDASAHDLEKVGNKLYAPPEYYVANMPLTMASDNWGIAWIIHQLLLGKNNPAMGIVNEIDSINVAKQVAADCHFEKYGIFVGEKHEKRSIDLTDQHKKASLELLNKMVLVDPKLRASDEEALNLFENILLDRRLEMIVDNVLKESIINAYWLGVELRNEADKITLFNADKEIIKKYEARLLGVVETLPSYPNALAAFLDRLNVNILKGSHDKVCLKDKISSVINNYLGNLKKMEKLYQAILKTMKSTTYEKQLNLKKISHRIELLIGRALFRSMSLDNFHYLSLKYQKYYEQLNADFLKEDFETHAFIKSSP